MPQKISVKFWLSFCAQFVVAAVSVITLAVIYTKQSLVAWCMCGALMMAMAILVAVLTWWPDSQKGIHSNAITKLVKSFVCGINVLAGAGVIISACSNYKYQTLVRVTTSIACFIWLIACMTLLIFVLSIRG